jgi:hypothetical protein
MLGNNSVELFLRDWWQLGDRFCQHLQTPNQPPNVAFRTNTVFLIVLLPQSLQLMIGRYFQRSGDGKVRFRFGDSFIARMLLISSQLLSNLDALSGSVRSRSSIRVRTRATNGRIFFDTRKALTRRSSAPF